MTPAETLALSPPPRSFVLGAVLSLVVHGGLLTAAGLLSNTALDPKAVPVVQISILSAASGLPSDSPAEPQPSLRSVSRSMTPQPPAVTFGSQLSASPKRLVSSPLRNPPSPAPSIISPKKRVLKDLHAVNALVGRKLARMSPSRSNPSPTFPIPERSLSTVASKKTQIARSTLVSPTASSAEAPLPPSPFNQRRVLKARPPGSQGGIGSKVGIIRSIKPIYPSVAKKAGWEGTVIVRVLVQSNGLPGEVKVQKSSGYTILDSAATDAVRKWRFQPEKDGNIPVKKYVDIPLKFDLQNL